MAKTLPTYEDYAELPEDGRRYELHAGDLWVTPAPSPSHQRVVVKLVSVLETHVTARALGTVLVSPIDCILTAHTVLQPDILWVGLDRLSIVTGRAVEGAPSLVVEVLSPSTSTVDLGRKRDLYAEHRVPFYWIVDPAARTIEAQRLEARRYQPVARLAATTPAALPPFDDLLIDPAVVWA